MKRLPIVILMVVAASFLAFKTMGTGPNNSTNPPTKYEQILRLIGEIFSQAHYSPQKIDDSFSQKVFKKYMNDLDGDKSMFLQSDLDKLKKFETTIDEEIKGAPVEFFLAAGKVFNTRMEEASVIYTELLSKPFEFTTDENVVFDTDKLLFSKNLADRKERWRKKMKFMTLERYTDLLDVREKNKGKEGFVVKTDAELEKDAREKVKRAMDRTFERYRFKFSDDDKFNVFVNSITTTMDPHSEFFPPVDKRYFDEEMSGRFYGIGASFNMMMEILKYQVYCLEALHGNPGKYKLATLL